MKLLFLICGCEQGGVATAFVALATELEKMGHEVKVVLPFYKHNREKKIAIPQRYILGWTPDIACGIPHLRPAWRVLNCIFNWKLYFRRVSCSYKYDKFILYHGFDYDVIFRWFRKVPSILWMHEMASERTCIKKNPLGSNIERLINKSLLRAVRGYDCYVAVSNNAAIALKKYYDLKSTPVVINNLIDVEKVQRLANLTQTEIRSSLTPNIGYVGRLSAEKGVDRLLLAALSLRRLGYQFNIWIVGSGPSYAELQDFSSTNQLDNIHFLGAKENPYKYMHACDLIVLPSREEGMGLVLWESILCGTPVLATETGGSINALSEGRWGKLVANDDKGILDGLRGFLENPRSIIPSVGIAKICSEITQRDLANRKQLQSILVDGKCNG